jgi:hypothetical protein
MCDKKNSLTRMLRITVNIVALIEPDNSIDARDVASKGTDKEK